MVYLILNLVMTVIAYFTIKVMLYNAYERGNNNGWEKCEEQINLKIRQDGYILDGKRVRKTVDEDEKCTKDIQQDKLKELVEENKNLREEIRAEYLAMDKAPTGIVVTPIVRTFCGKEIKYWLDLEQELKNRNKT